MLAVGAADPVGMQRLVRGSPSSARPCPEPCRGWCVNRVRRGAVGAEPEGQLAEALERYAGVRDPAYVPEDREALDAALLQARALHEVDADSKARVALAGIAAGLVGRPAPGRRRGLLRR